jgi:ribonuclease R
LNRKKSPTRPRGKAPFPSRQQVLDYIAANPQAAAKRDIARAFRLVGDDRVALRNMLREMKAEGLLERRAGGRHGEPGRLPSVTVIEVLDIDEDGELTARPAVWEAETPPPRILLQPSHGRAGPALTIGDRVLARLERVPEGHYLARTVRRLDRAAKRVIGLYETGPEGGRIRQAEKRLQKDLRLEAKNAGEAKPGDLVLAEVLPAGRGPRLGLRQARVIQRLGAFDDPQAFSLIALHEQGIPYVFPEEVLTEAAAAGPADEGAREDLRDLPLVTIDGADARDFDDAVYAEPDDDPKNPGGWRVLVAIADVAHYVRPDTALDREAYRRGNSVYFPDRVVPMLPEALSNGWCSLKPGEDRPCLGVWMTLDREGTKRQHRFTRGLMRSAARLTYETVQGLKDGEATAPSAAVAGLIGPLYGAFAALLTARERRGTLELDLPERQVIVERTGKVGDIVQRARLDSHKLIEEFMITANVAAAEELERRHRPCMYRNHEPPDPLKLEALGEVLRGFDLRLPKGGAVRPKALTGLLRKVAGQPAGAIVHQMILRAQSQAFYGPGNLGHFGLALARYAHFTSPIRRYADLLVHRALIAGPGDDSPGDDKTSPDGDRDAVLTEMGQHISFTERRAASAERDTVDRFTAAYMAERIGEILDGTVSGVTRFGLFVTLEPTGGDGLVTVFDLPDDRYHLHPKRQMLEGLRWGRRFMLGDRLRVRILEADAVSGTIRLKLADDDGVPEAEDEPARQGERAWDPLAAKRRPPRRRAGPRSKKSSKITSDKR